MFLQIELKMLESAQNLLHICQNETKEEKLREAVRTHKIKAEQLKQQVKDARGLWKQ